MRQLPVLTFVLCFFLGVTAVAGVAAGTQADSTAHNTTIQVNGEPLDQGDSRVLERDPSITISAETDVESPPGTVLDTVTVRRNDETIRTYDPGTREFEETITPPLDSGRNTITVIVEDTNGTVSSTYVYLTKDTFPPSITLTSPKYGPAGRITAETGDAVVTLAGQLEDDSKVRFVRARAQYNTQDSDNDTGLVRYSDRFRRTDPGTEFRGELVLNKGDSTIIIETEDELGNKARYRLPMTFEDTTDPTLNLAPVPERTAQKRLTIRGTATDNTWVANATLETRHVETDLNRSYILIPNKPYMPTRERLTAEFEEEIVLKEGINEFELTMQDHTGATVEVSKEIEYDPTLGEGPGPRIEISPFKTRFVTTNRIRVAGSVTDNTSLDSVFVESRQNALSSFDFEVIDANGRSFVPFNTTIQLPSGRSEVVVRATGPGGDRLRNSFGINTFETEITETTVPSRGSVTVAASVTPSNATIEGITVFARDPASNNLIASRELTVIPETTPVQVTETLDVGEREVRLGVSARDANGNRSVETTRFDVGAQYQPPTAAPTPDPTTPTTTVPTESASTPTENGTATETPQSSSALGTLLGFLLGVVPFVILGILLVFGGFFAVQKFS